MTSTTLAKNNFGIVQQVSLGNALKGLCITHKKCTASLSLYGGQVLTWQPVNQQPVFWLSETAHYQQGKAIRGGIPICWPWFGPYKDGGNHGFARQVMWQIDDIIISEQQVDITLSWLGERQTPLWSAPARLIQKVSFGEQFSQSLTIENFSDAAVEYTGALHSYFAVSHPENAHINQLSPIPYHCKLTNEENKIQPLKDAVGPMDRVYQDGSTMVIEDNGWQRNIEIKPINTHQWVLWNPGKVIAEGMADIHPRGENEFVCLEAANTQWQSISPNSMVTIGQKIRILPYK